MVGASFSISCPRCGGLVEHVTSGRPVAGTHTSSIVRCPPCHIDWQITVTLRPR
jgi:hypothetical protein